VLNEEIEKFLCHLLKDSILNYSLKYKIRIALTKPNNKEEHSFAYDILEEAHQFYDEFKRPKEESKYIQLHDLVKSSRIFNETLHEPKRSGELVKRLARLQAQQDQRDYDKMVSNVKRKTVTLGQEIGTVVRTTKQQSMTLINFLISIAATFAFAYVSSKYAFTEDFGYRLIFSIVAATVVGLAELFFMSRYEI